MSSTNAGFGLRPKYDEQGYVRPRVYVNGIQSGYASALLKYQPVTMSGGFIIQASLAADWLGVFAGWEGVDSTGRHIISNQWLANQTYSSGNPGDYPMRAYVWDDPYTIYSIQANGSVPATSLGVQADFVNIASGNTTIGMSTAQLNSSLKTTGQQGQLRILELSIGPITGDSNVWGDAFTEVRVQNARHLYVANKTSL
jgi:hypothetical protein